MTALDDTTAMASASPSIGSPVLDGSAVARSITKTLPRSISSVIRARLEAADGLRPVLLDEEEQQYVHDRVHLSATDCGVPR